MPVARGRSARKPAPPNPERLADRGHPDPAIRNAIDFFVQPTGSFVKLQGFLTPDLLPGKTLDDVRRDGPVNERLESYFATPRLGQPGTVFAAPPPMGWGDLGRGLSIRAPDQRSSDLSLVRGIRLSEGSSLQFRGELYNTFNRVNFGPPGTNVSTTGFGTITSTTTAPRVVQLAIKLLF